jgi:hypothetical protein
MHLLYPSPISLIRSEASFSNEVEVLQTDVMRFFAILCLCLMAIFALVKTLPMAPSTGPPTMVEPTDLKADAEALQKHTAMLKEKLAQLRTQVQAAAVDAEKSSTVASVAEKKEQEVLTRLTRAQQEFKSISESLEETRGALKTREMKLTEIMNDLDNKERIRSALKFQIEDESQHLAEIQAKLERDRVKLNQPPSGKIPAEIIPAEENPAPQPVRQGFSLRFTSDAALQRLIDSGKVNFYAFAGKKAWQLHLRDGQPVYSSARFPSKIYEMQTATVPIEYSGVFQRQVAAFSRTTVTWGVTLPSQTTASINRLIQGRNGADLVITAAGEVVLK